MIKPTKFMNSHLTIFHIYHFVIEKLQTHFYEINRIKLVLNYQTEPKYIFEGKKRNGPITSNFGPIKNLTNSSYNLKSVQIL